MKLFEMEGFLRGKCIPRDLKVNETNAEYLVRKFGELESKLETALRECRSAGITIDNLEAKCAALAVENAGLKSFGDKLNEMHNDLNGEGTGIQGRAEVACQQVALEAAMEEFDAIKTPATDAFLAEVRAHDLNAFIQHHSAELDAHIKNGGEQFDEKSVRIRDIIVSARLFREQIRKGVRS
ncbi:hNH endonuclease [Escherichia coli]|uniref:hNH endonuclease n=1 Tax=Escherichia coli TaxID=562 RepID=UPI001C7048F9|nr:hNH endonuclease [Escherichia coli]MBW9631034.1 hNH endonuclease [Escherichia coli]